MLIDTSGSLVNATRRLSIATIVGEPAISGLSAMARVVIDKSRTSHRNQVKDHGQMADSSGHERSGHEKVSRLSNDSWCSPMPDEMLPVSGHECKYDRSLAKGVL